MTTSKERFMAAARELWESLKGNIIPPKPDPCAQGHDMDMAFPDPTEPMAWQFMCTRCGCTTKNMNEALWLLHRKEL